MRVRLLLVLLLVSGCGRDRALARAEAALDAGDLAAAEERFRAVLDAEPGNTQARYGLGWVWHLSGREDDAREAFQQILLTDPHASLGHKGLGSLALAAGNLDVARAEFTAALSGASDDLALRHSLVLVDLASRDGAAALSGVDALLVRAPERAELHETRAEALLLLGRAEEALEAADTTLRRGGSDRIRRMARVTRARVLLALTRDRVDPQRCAETAPPVRVWLDEADHMLDEVVALGSDTPELTEVRRSVHRARTGLGQTCPDLPPAAALGKESPGG